MRRVFAAVLFLLTVMRLSVFADAGLSDVEKGFVRLEYIARQVESVENGLRFYYMAKLQEQPKSDPDKEAGQLKRLREELSGADLPREIHEPAFTLKNAIIKLQENCEYLVRKEQSVRMQEAQEFRQMMDDYHVQLKYKLNQLVSISTLDKAFSLIEEETKLFEVGKDREKFRKAAILTSSKKYDEALDLLKPLLEKYNGQIAQGSILVRMVDCYIVRDKAREQDGAGEEYALGLLQDFMGRKPYAFPIQRLYFQWRTLKQMHNEGVSNWSAIPNELYDQLLWGLAQAAEKYIELHPQDAWAKQQLFALMDTPVIRRFVNEYSYGNSVAGDYASLSQ